VRHFSSICVITLALLVGSCGTTPYQPDGLIGGYSDSQINANTYRISFEGQHITEESVDTYLLYRCAELILEMGFDCFTVVDSHVGGTSYSEVSRASAGNIIKSLTIKISRGQRPQGVQRAYVAKDLKAELEPKIKR
jgi:hypothetical protein